MKWSIEIGYEINNDLKINPMLDAVLWTLLVSDFDLK